MYPPPYYTDNTPAFTAGVMREHSFAVLSTTDETGAIHATHLPLILKPEGTHGTLYGHIAKNNPQAKHLDTERPAMAVFSGPHAYISASLYDHPEKSVPTWDYISVQASGFLTALPREDYMTEMQTLVDAYEPSDGWSIDSARQYSQALLGGIVYFKMPITSLMGIRKMSQNKSHDERGRIAAHLRANNEYGTADAIALTLI